MSLIQHLQTVRDYRTQPDYPLWVILVLIVMGTMSGCTGYRSLADFVSRHQAALLEIMELPYARLPGFSTLRRMMVRVDFISFTEAFNQWAQEHCAPAPNEPVPVDGKGIKASLRDYDQSYQDFVSVVSAFSVQQGVVLGLESMRNQECSEIKTAQVLLEKLQLQGVCFSLDALHTQKKQRSRSLPAAMIT
jgi:DDE_Tnp_1-associated